MGNLNKLLPVTQKLLFAIDSSTSLVFKNVSVINGFDDEYPGLNVNPTNEKQAYRSSI